jgi:tripartite-type tricarboxylate transporter receptor subunit TctC
MLASRHLTCAALLLATASSVMAQGYPTRPVRMIVPYATGGGSDVLGRILAQRLTDGFGQQFVVDNRTGANGIVGTELAARSPADGYVLLFVSSPHAINVSMYPKLPFDTLRDFSCVAGIAITPFMLVTHASMPVKTLRDLVALAKARPGQIDYASGGAGGSPHLAAELFKHMTKTDITHIPYKGAGPALADVVAGQVPVMFANTAPALPHVRSGRLRALGIGSLQRSQVAPDIPTIAEQGLPGYESSASFSLLAPAKTPREIIVRLNAQALAGMRTPDTAARIVDLGAELALTSPEACGAAISAEVKRWGDLVRALNLRVE